MPFVGFAKLVTITMYETWRPIWAQQAPTKHNVRYCWVRDDYRPSNQGWLRSNGNALLWICLNEHNINKYFTADWIASSHLNQTRQEPEQWKASHCHILISIFLSPVLENNILTAPTNLCWLMEVKFYPCFNSASCAEPVIWGK